MLLDGVHKVIPLCDERIFIERDGNHPRQLFLSRRLQLYDDQLHVYGMWHVTCGMYGIDSSRRQDRGGRQSVLDIPK